MANTSLKTGAEGLSELETAEASIDGLYNDQSGYATFGVGHLVDKSDKWSSFLLSAATADKRWAGCVKKRWPGTPHETVYLERAALAASEFEVLKASAKELGRDVVAKRRYGKAYAGLQSGEQQTVDGIIASAVQEEVRLLGFQVKDVLARDLTEYERPVRNKVTVDLSQDEFDALVSFTFNVGAGAFSRSKLLEKINDGGWRSGTIEQREKAIAAIEAEFMKYTKSGGVVVPGLTRRRAREAEKFLRGAREALADLKSRVRLAGTRSSSIMSRPWNDPGR